MTHHNPHYYPFQDQDH